jgi:hypothetical protein
VYRACQGGHAEMPPIHLLAMMVLSLVRPTMDGPIFSGMMVMVSRIKMLIVVLELSVSSP